MKKLSILSFAISAAFLTSAKVSAHCPLCTGGAGAAAVAAAYFGVKYGALGVLLGGFTTALALWLAHKPNRQYIQKQSTILFWAIYLSTVIPFYYMFRGDYTSYYLSWGGDYGSWTNRTYLFDLFVIGTIAGSLIVFLSPRVSAWISRKRGGKQIRFQGLLITFALLGVAGAMLQVWPR